MLWAESSYSSWNALFKSMIYLSPYSLCLEIGMSSCLFSPLLFPRFFITMDPFPSKYNGLCMAHWAKARNLVVSPENWPSFVWFGRPRLLEILQDNDLSAVKSYQYVYIYIYESYLILLKSHFFVPKKWMFPYVSWKNGPTPMFSSQKHPAFGGSKTQQTRPARNDGHPPSISTERSPEKMWVQWVTEKTPSFNYLIRMVIYSGFSHKKNVIFRSYLIINMK